MDWLESSICVCLSRFSLRKSGDVCGGALWPAGKNKITSLFSQAASCMKLKRFLLRYYPPGEEETGGKCGEWERERGRAWVRLLQKGEGGVAASLHAHLPRISWSSWCYVSLLLPLPLSRDYSGIWAGRRDSIKVYRPPRSETRVSLYLLAITL